VRAFASPIPFPTVEAGLRLAADPDPADGARLEASSVIVTRRDLLLVTSLTDPAVDRVGGERGRRDRGDAGAREECDPQPSIGRNERDSERHDEESDEARLRVRVVETCEQERDERSKTAHSSGFVCRKSRTTSRTAIARRAYLPYRLGSLKTGHAEERRVGVWHLERAREEKRSAVVSLPEPDRREERGESSESEHERTREPRGGAAFRARTRGRRRTGTRRRRDEAASCVSHVQRNETAVNTTKDAVGSDRKRGGGAGLSPRTIRYASARTAEAEDE